MTDQAIEGPSGSGTSTLMHCMAAVARAIRAARLHVLQAITRG